MFKFKKAMQGTGKEEGFECECCGPMDGKSSNQSTGCGCGPINTSCCGPKVSSCCGPVKSSCGDTESNCNTNQAEKSQTITQSDCSCSECK